MGLLAGTRATKPPPRYLTDEVHLYRLIGPPDAQKGQEAEDVRSGYLTWLDSEAVAACRVIEPAT